MTSTAHLNHQWCSLLIGELLRNGVNTFCLSPGSRNTPLVLAVAQAVESGSAQTVIHFDERGAAFYALGWAKAIQRPVALLCTSGTAAANYLPAIIEASQDNVPLIVLTADRPPELLDTGANQSIDQVKLYGNYVRWQFTLPCPDENIPVSLIQTTIDQAVYRAVRSPAGPVHIDCMFREPFTDIPECSEEVSAFNSLPNTPYTVYAPFKSDPKPAQEALNPIFQNTRRGVIIVGALHSEAERCAVQIFAKSLQWPVLADIASGLRMGERKPPYVTYYNQLLLIPEFRKQFAPETVIHIGGSITSKCLTEYLLEHTPKNFVRIANHPMRHDPLHHVSLRIELDIAQIDQVLPFNPQTPDLAWCKTIFDADTQVDTIIDRCLETVSFAEPHLVRLLAAHIPEKTALFLGNSMPIRAMDFFAQNSGASVPVEVNRGASGIDGLVATASGYARGITCRTTLLVGDLSLLHDLNSLALAAQANPPLIIVVINNNGGGIFHFLPVAHATHHLEKYFVTPHNVTFDHAAALFGIQYAHVANDMDFVEAYKTALDLSRSSLIEVTMNHVTNLSAYDAVKTAIRQDFQRKETL